MKKQISLILFSAGLIFSANVAAQQPGSNANSSNVNTVTNKTTPSPQDGNGTLGSTYVFNKCGLNYVTASNKLGQRFVISCCPSTPGVAQPAPFAISGIPSGAVIEKAFLWFDISGSGVSMTVTIKIGRASCR